MLRKTSGRVGIAALYSQDAPMPYSTFNLSKVKTDFKLIFVENQDLFGDVQTVSPSEYLNLIFSEHLPLVTAINTEKARYELIIMPVLIEVKRFFQYQISIFSGSEFNRPLAK
ncbi:MAG: hypothetical protein V7K21_08240 [Nostoc sp.]|uniref:hypothetical protein n=1 Tax=Nostoc sp. TaxID=1180 RepID=UPI002FF6ECF0